MRIRHAFVNALSPMRVVESLVTNVSPTGIIGVVSSGQAGLSPGEERRRFGKLGSDSGPSLCRFTGCSSTFVASPILLRDQIRLSGTGLDKFEDLIGHLLRLLALR
jgi:hypothetical protein